VSRHMPNELTPGPLMKTGEKMSERSTWNSGTYRLYENSYLNRESALCCKCTTAKHKEGEYVFYLCGQ